MFNPFEMFGKKKAAPEAEPQKLGGEKPSRLSTIPFTLDGLLDLIEPGLDRVMDVLDGAVPDKYADKVEKAASQVMEKVAGGKADVPVSEVQPSDAPGSGSVEAGGGAKGSDLPPAAGEGQGAGGGGQGSVASA